MAQCACKALPWRVSALTLCAASVLSSTTAQAALGTAVEYYHPVLRHYFMTAYPRRPPCSTAARW
jgi:hypothetical protein